MATLPPTLTLTPAQQAAMGMRRLLRDLGAAESLVLGVHGDWSTLEGVPHVYLPPLPATLVDHLTRLLPPGAVS